MPGVNAANTPSTDDGVELATRKRSERWNPRRSLESSRGSEWRLWDLHLHPPGTKLSNTYGQKPDWDRFCKILEESPVAAFGIADYFFFDGFFAVVNEFAERSCKSPKVFFPNLELRLNESVNKALEMVDIHLILRPDLDEKTANRLLHQLATEVYDSNRKLSCAELQTAAHFEAATVTRDALGKAVDTVFGSGRNRRDNVIVVVPANNSGSARAGSRTSQSQSGGRYRRRPPTQFSAATPTRAHFSQRRDRYEGGTLSRSQSRSLAAVTLMGSMTWRPGSESTLKIIESTYQIPTWIKGDVTFEGLQQTLVEPKERVRLQATRPDQKDPYKVISKITFNDPSTFPPEVLSTRTSCRSSVAARPGSRRC